MPSSSKKGSSKAETYKYLILTGNESVLMAQALQRRPWWSPAKAMSDSWSLWFGGNGQKFDFSHLISPGNVRIANRLEGHGEVCTKTGLANTIARIQSSLKSGPLPWAPLTFTLPGGLKDKAGYNRFCQTFKEHEARGAGSTWICKPASLNRGNGIEVFNTCNDIVAHLQSKKSDSKWIVQKYIEKPALVQGRKFDIRAYVLVTPDKKLYMCKEAYVRTSSTPYCLEDLSDKSAHLTNDAVQKHLSTYHAYEDHCKMDMVALQESLGPSIDIQGTVWPAMRDCVRHVFGAALPNMNPRGLKHCWELLGLDFMIDDQGKVFLIEVNTSPALFRAGSYLTDLLPRVVEECVQKAVDPFFAPPPGTAEDQLPETLDNFEQLEPLVLSESTRFSSPTRRSSSLRQSPSKRGVEPVGAVLVKSLSCVSPVAADTSSAPGKAAPAGRTSNTRVLRHTNSDATPACWR